VVDAGLTVVIVVVIWSVAVGAGNSVVAYRAVVMGVPFVKLVNGIRVANVPFEVIVFGDVGSGVRDAETVFARVDVD
jgi:hypothetical protein